MNCAARVLPIHRAAPADSEKGGSNVLFPAGAAQRHHRLMGSEATILSAASMPNMRPALRHPQ